MASPNRASSTSRLPPPRAHLRPATYAARPSTGTHTPEGSITTTLTPSHLPADGLVLRLRGAHETRAAEQSASGSGSGRRIHWAEGVVDNEGLGRKRSKVCCIFHKTREFGESSSEDDSSSSDESSDSNDDGAARPAGGYKRGRKRQGRNRGHGHKHDDDGDGCDAHGHGHAKGKRKPSPNAYERMPRYDVKPLERQPGT